MTLTKPPVKYPGKECSIAEILENNLCRSRVLCSLFPSASFAGERISRLRSKDKSYLFNFQTVIRIFFLEKTFETGTHPAALQILRFVNGSVCCHIALLESDRRA